MEYESFVKWLVEQVQGKPMRAPHWWPHGEPPHDESEEETMLEVLCVLCYRLMDKHLRPYIDLFYFYNCSSPFT